MKNRFISFMLAVVAVMCCVSFSGCTQTETRPAMWLLEKDGTKIYFLGSIHIADDTMYPLPDYINEAYESSDYLAVEYDIVREEAEQEKMTQQEWMEYYAQFMYTDGTTARDHMNGHQYTTVKGFLQENGQYSEQLEYFKLCMWESTVTSILLGQTGYEYENGIDRHFLHRAHDSGKTVLDVESEQFQIEMMLDLPDSMVADSMCSMVESAAASPDSVKLQYDYLMDIYKRGRDDLISGQLTLTGFVNDTAGEEYEAYNNAMYTDRNIGMKNAALRYLSEGKNVFYVVGFAHMCGDDGIIELLKAEGYDVKRVDK